MINRSHHGLFFYTLLRPAINEIHGAWYDPSNPVVKFSGTLRDDCWAQMEDWEDKMDLSLTLGTSLSGMSADCMASTPGEKFMTFLAREGYTRESEGIDMRSCPILGTVIVNLQKTQFDHIASLRIFAKVSGGETLAI